MESMILPALRGVFGDRVYYVTTMPLADVADRVNFAQEVHKSDALNQLIQRRLDGGRGREIATYLKETKQRFFNAMVVGVYGSDPNWYDFDKITKLPSSDIELPSNAVEQLGFLGLDGRETLFAIDGQHRLSGIKQAVEQAREKLQDDRMAIIFVAHQKGATGLQRTRRLFTVLNKTAKPVLKGDIIALDEDDVMAICTRKLVSESKLLRDGQVAMRLKSSLPPNDKTSWTTIVMIYDVLAIVFEKIYHPHVQDAPVKLKQLKNERPSDSSLRSYYDYAHSYFELWSEFFPEVAEVMAASSTEEVVTKYRHAEGGSVLYRPVGQRIFTQVIERLTHCYSLKEAFEWASLLPTDLSEEPYAEVIWNTRTRRMSNASSDSKLVREILLFMLKEDITMDLGELKNQYSQHFDQNEVRLPSPVVD